jgi:hypothetical protein
MKKTISGMKHTGERNECSDESGITKCVAKRQYETADVVNPLF